ncbi:uncharacterized protein [Halyomorpha halys]|uniref:uncharacterized protein n=1 Tax=Halyomorpha halys TaxID=286706 RepID=UPI0006D51AAA|nr:uncharacterized protein DDB_G0284671 [Halyomorpha halys]
MKHTLVFLITAIIQDFYHYGVLASPTSTALLSSAEDNSDSEIDEDSVGKPSVRSGIFTTSFSSSSGPGGWTSIFSGPETGGKVISFSSPSFSSQGTVQISKSESSSNGNKQIQTVKQIITLPSDSDDFSAQTGGFVSEEDEETIPSYSVSKSSGGVQTRLLGGSSGSRSGLLGLGLLGIL